MPSELPTLDPDVQKFHADRLREIIEEQRRQLQQLQDLTAPIEKKISGSARLSEPTRARYQRLKEAQFWLIEELNRNVDQLEKMGWDNASKNTSDPEPSQDGAIGLPIIEWKTAKDSGHLDGHYGDFRLYSIQVRNRGSFSPNKTFPTDYRLIGLKIIKACQFSEFHPSVASAQKSAAEHLEIFMHSVDRSIARHTV